MRENLEFKQQRLEFHMNLWYVVNTLLFDLKESISSGGGLLDFVYSLLIEEKKDLSHYVLILISFILKGYLVTKSQFLLRGNSKSKKKL